MDETFEKIKFGKQVVRLRTEKGLSQEALAFQSGINRTYIGEVERGEKCPSLIIITKIAKGLGVSKKNLMDYE